MNMSELSQMIQERKQQLCKPYQRDPGYEYCKEFIQKNPTYISQSFFDMDAKTFFHCYYYIVCSDPDKDIHKISQFIDSFIEFYHQYDLSSAGAVVDICSSILDSGLEDDVLHFMREDSLIQSRLLYRKISKVDSELARFLGALKEDGKKNDFDVGNLFEFYFKDYDHAMQISSFYSSFLELKNQKKMLSVVLPSLKQKEVKKALSSRYRLDRMYQTVGVVSSFVSSIESEEKHYGKECQKEIYGLDNAFSMLEKGLESPEITNARDIVRGIRDAHVKLAFLEIINEHNMGYYQSLNEELNLLQSNSSLQYQSLLNSCEIPYDDNLLQGVMRNGLDDVEEMVNILKKLNLPSTSIISILAYSNLECIIRVRDFINKGWIPSSFILSNIDIFYVDSLKYENYSRHLDLLKELSINPYLFQHSVFVLFDDIDIFSKNLKILQEYDLLKCLRSTSDYGFLVQSQLNSRIDLLLELGFEEFLENDLGLLNHDNLSRLEVLKALNIPITSKEELYQVLECGTSFFVPDSEIDSYIPDVIPYEEERELAISMEDLESFRVSSRVYSFDGVLVSSPKVFKKISEGESLYSSILSSMHLDQEEYTRFLNSVSIGGSQK